MFNNNVINTSRRRFLESLCKAGVSQQALKCSSLLAGVFANRYAMAEDRVKRVIFVYTPCGAPEGLWLPRGNQLNLATQAFEGLQQYCHFRQVEVVYSGVGLSRKSMGDLRWGGDWTADTIDHQIARVLGVATPYPNLFFGVQTQLQLSGYSKKIVENMSYRRGEHVMPMESPRFAYDYLFGGSQMEIPSSNNDNNLTQKAKILAMQQEALACNKNLLSEVELNTIEHYQQALVELQLRTQQAHLKVEACATPSWNNNHYKTDGPSASNPGVFAEQSELQSDIICAALACGLTSVVSLQLSTSVSGMKGHNTKYTGSLYESTQAAGAKEFAELVNYLGKGIAYLISKLANTDDPANPGQKLLDNTVVIQVTDQGDGRNHSGDVGPSLIATNMPEFKTGLATRGGTNNLQVLQAVAVGLGLEQYIGKDSHHCIWPCAQEWGGLDEGILRA